MGADAIDANNADPYTPMDCRVGNVDTRHKECRPSLRIVGIVD